MLWTLESVLSWIFFIACFHGPAFGTHCWEVYFILHPTPMSYGLNTDMVIDLFIKAKSIASQSTVTRRVTAFFRKMGCVCNAEVIEVCYNYFKS